MSVAAMRLMFKALGLLFRVELIVVTPCMGSVINTTETDCDYFTHYKVRLENGDVTCRRCTKCDHSKGEGTIFECQNYTDTICAPCKDGETYSLEYDEATVCDECKSCEEGQEVLENCTRFNDIKCGMCLPGYKYDDVTGDCIKVDIVQVKPKITYAHDQTDLMAVPMKTLVIPSTTELINATPTQPDGKNTNSYVIIIIVLGMAVVSSLVMIVLLRPKCVWQKKNARAEEGNRMISQEHTADDQPLRGYYDNFMSNDPATDDTGLNSRNQDETIVGIAPEPADRVNQCDTESESENCNVHSHHSSEHLYTTT
ncbi:tumor necrosis factor receptor superfamily member 16 [Lingula anatina]|uniref:Tumor necrosis factor receptor superfamily member 16 n=1 Tax=Lingula anatina TaxID=7574 RepID=A0A1S3HZ12_LINAN|nr:tumor necrosis factor receptor superfamily member 16 [Lingula anatina]|eukprot:XP_013391262.1 tumor necrosis factor receptor superfamily member 16 [Lingula anatina]